MYDSGSTITDDSTSSDWYYRRKVRKQKRRQKRRHTKPADDPTSSDDTATEVSEKTVSRTTTIDDYIKEAVQTEEKLLLLPSVQEHNTRVDTALGKMSDAELTKLIDNPIERAESTKRKEAWVLSLYTPWCLRTNYPQLFPLYSAHVCAFIRFMAIYCGYALSGIKFIVVPALKHMHIDHIGSLDPQISQDLSHTIRVLSYDKRVIKAGQGKPPLCSFDVAELTVISLYTVHLL